MSATMKQWESLKVKCYCGSKMKPTGFDGEWINFKCVNERRHERNSFAWKIKDFFRIRERVARMGITEREVTYTFPRMGKTKWLDPPKTPQLGTYFCQKCGNNHNPSSRIGIAHGG